MKKVLFLFILLYSGFISAYKLTNYSNATFVGNDELLIEVMAGQTVNQTKPMINGVVYGYVNVDKLNINQCFFEAGSRPINWSKVIIPIQYADEDLSCTLALPRLCCLDMPEEF